jgi:hypothetical protein
MTDNLIEEVARLKEQIPPEPGIINLRYTKELLNATPALLDVLSEIRAGDAEKMRVISDWFKQMPLLDEPWVRELLNRYQAIAAKMVAGK